jgi:phosphatidylglycerol:prolipoprotein diacylglycerol transferase
MYPRLLHIYGPIWINSYGVMIALGFLVFTFLVLRHPLRKKIIPKKTFIDMLLCGLLSGIIGGRLLFIAEQYSELSDNWIELLYPWVGGFSVLGTVIGVLIVVPLFLRKHSIPILPVLDLAGLYAPLFQSIARIGCFLSGCCHGLVASPLLPWAIYYTHPDSQAPLGVFLHPTQIYSSIASLLLFLVLRFLVSKRVTIPGQLIYSYLIGESFLRFVVDFWRGDRTEVFVILRQPLSFSQVIAVAVGAFGLCGLWYVSFFKKNGLGDGVFLQKGSNRSYL